MSGLTKTTADYGIGSANAEIITESTEINALKSISKAVKDIDNLNLIQRKLFDKIEHTHQNFFIQGQAGTGKSTFIKAIMGQQELSMEGTIFVGPSVKIGYLPQIINFSNGEQSLLEYFKHEVGLNEERARQILAKFQFLKGQSTAPLNSRTLQESPL